MASVLSRATLEPSGSVRSPECGKGCLWRGSSGNVSRHWPLTHGVERQRRSTDNSTCPFLPVQASTDSGAVSTRVQTGTGKTEHPCPETLESDLIQNAMRVRTSSDDLGVQGLVGGFAGLPSCGDIPPRGRKSCREVACYRCTGNTPWDCPIDNFEPNGKSLWTVSRLCHGLVLNPWDVVARRRPRLEETPGVLKVHAASHAVARRRSLVAAVV
jgi:hypothetical protein